MPANSESSPNRAQHPDQSVNPEINGPEAEAWINSFTQPEAQDAARWLVDNITRITFRDFQRELIDLLEVVKKEIADVPYITLAPRDSMYQKSETWVAQMAVDLGLVPPQDIVLAKHIASYVNTHPDIRYVLYFDDASYSGDRIRTNMLGQSINLMRHPNLMYKIIIPYMTSFAANMAKEVVQQSLRPKVRVFNRERISTIDDLLMKEPLPRQKQLMKAFSQYMDINMDRDSYGITLTYFDHKVGDWLSFPESVRKGWVRDENGEIIATHQFIPEIIPPYKRPGTNVV